MDAVHGMLHMSCLLSCVAVLSCQDAYQPQDAGTYQTQDGYMSSWGDRVPPAVCAAGCHCFDKGSVMTCRLSQLTHIPALLSTTIVLDLDYNHINIIHNMSMLGSHHIQVISLQHNGIIHIEAGAFVPLTQLTILKFGNNHLSYLPRDLFWNNQNLQVLDLHGNAFVEMPDNIMYHLHSLNVLNMSDNHLTTPMLGAGFKYTTQLSSLDLSGNNFVTLDAHVFQATLWWDEHINHFLNLSYCNIQHIHPNALSQLYRLEALSLAGNNDISQNDLITALHDLEVSSLQILNLSNMNITDISQFFCRFQHRNLLHLDVSANNIKEIKSRSFYYLTNLKILDVSNNQLDSIGDMSGLSHLEHLNLAYNNIRSIAHTSFEGLQAVQIMDLSHNALRIIENTPFEKLWELHTLDISCNQVSIFTITSGLENLEHLNMAFNQITNLSSIRCLLRLKTLDLSSNLIAKLDHNLFSRGHNLEVVNFSHNAISEIDSLAFSVSAQETLDLSHNRLMKLTNFGWQRIKHLHLQSNVITNISSSAFQGLSSILYLNLASNNLHWLPHQCLTQVYNLKHLSVSYNPLAVFLQAAPTVSMLNGLWKLQQLDMSHLHLHTLPLNMFVNLTLLQTLDLSGNKLTQLPWQLVATCYRLKHLNLSNNLLAVPNPDVFAAIVHLELLDLSHNPLQCTCHLMPFRNWLLTTNLTVAHSQDPYYYSCIGPPEWNNIPLSDFLLQSNTCSHPQNAVLYCAVGCTLLALITTAMCAVYRYRWWGKHPKLVHTQYSVINESALVQLNPHHDNSRDWV